MNEDIWFKGLKNIYEVRSVKFIASWKVGVKCGGRLFGCVARRRKLGKGSEINEAPLMLVLEKYAKE